MSSETRPFITKKQGIPKSVPDTGLFGRIMLYIAAAVILILSIAAFALAVSTYLENQTQNTRLDGNQVAIQSETVARTTAVDTLTATDVILQAEVADRIASLSWVHGDNTTHNVDLVANGTGITIRPNHTDHSISLTNDGVLEINGVPPVDGVGTIHLDGTGMIDIISTASTSTVTVDGSMIVTQLSNLQAQVSMQQVEILELQTNQTQVQTVVDALVAALSAISGGMNGTQDLNMTITQLVVNVTMATIQIAQLQAQVANLTAIAFMPGMLIPWGGSAGGPYPAGWLLCDGSEYLITDYPALYAKIGAMYCPGPCSNINNFAVPDMRGRTIVHKGGSVLNTAIGTKLGEETHTLSIAEMPAHDHSGFTTGIGDHQHTIPGRINLPGSGGYPDGTDLEGIYSDFTGLSGAHSHGILLQGSGTPHNNIQPSMVMQYLIKT